MKWFLISLGLLSAGLTGWTWGYDRGIEDAPSVADAMEDRTAESERQHAEWMAYWQDAEMSEEATCSAIMDLARERLTYEDSQRH